MDKKMGRPVSPDSKKHKLTVRVDTSTLEKIDKYCSKYNLNRGETIRKGIEKLDE